MSSSNPRWLVWCLQETHTCSAPDGWMRKLSNSRQSHWESPALYQPTGAHVSKVQCFRQIPVSEREKKKRQNDLHKCSSAVLPRVCGTAHQKRECVYREGKGVGTLHPVSCCESTVSLHAWTHFRNSSHIRLVSGSHAFKWGSEAAQVLFEKVAECQSKITISWGEFWERGVWWLLYFFPLFLFPILNRRGLDSTTKQHCIQEIQAKERLSADELPLSVSFNNLDKG